MWLGQVVTVPEVLALAVAGVVAGIISTTASLASVVSYPALLAIGLPPLTANMTNTVSLVFSGVGAAAGSRPELAGQAARIRQLGPVAAFGGGVGAALLLLTPARTFELIAPILIAAGSLVLLAQPGQAPASRVGAGDHRNPLLLTGVFFVAIYVGYFGAAGGILMLAILAVRASEPMARTNAVKNVIGALANGVAALAFAFFGQVDWAAVVPLAAGFMVGGWTGPALVRRLPGRAFRFLVAGCGLAVAAKLGISAYQGAG